MNCGEHTDGGPWIGAELFYNGEPVEDWSFDSETFDSDIIGMCGNTKVRISVEDQSLTWK